MSLFVQLLVFGLLAAGGTLLGGWLVTGRRALSQRRMRDLIGIGAGFMLAAVFLEVIPAVVEGGQGVSFEQSMWLLLAGYLLIQLVEHAIASHFHFGEEVHEEEIRRRGAATTAVIALGVHSFLDGVTIASGLLVSLRLGVVLALAVLIHKLPEGFTVASIMLSAGRSARAARAAAALLAGLTFGGVFSVLLAQPFVAVTLPLSAGATLYVAASDLIPEVNRDSGARASLLVLAGVAAFALVHFLLHSALAA
jgi:zinc transporter ZupT